LEAVEGFGDSGSSGGGRRVWRRSEALEEVEGSGGSTARSSGEGTKLWRRHEALEVVEGSGGGQRVGRRSKTPEAASTKLWKRQQALEAGLS
jgi:hypothetical protein